MYLLPKYGAYNEHIIRAPSSSDCGTIAVHLSCVPSLHRCMHTIHSICAVLYNMPLLELLSTIHQFMKHLKHYTIVLVSLIPRLTPCASKRQTRKRGGGKGRTRRAWERGEVHVVRHHSVYYMCVQYKYVDIVQTKYGKGRHLRVPVLTKLIATILEKKHFSRYRLATCKLQ